MKQLRLTAAALLIYSCFSHFAEAVIVAPAHAIGSMIFGFIYFVIGLLLIMKHPKAYPTAAIFTTLGLLAGLVILIRGGFNFYLLIHLAIDAFVIYVCLKHYKKI